MLPPLGMAMRETGGPLASASTRSDRNENIFSFNNNDDDCCSHSLSVTLST